MRINELYQKNPNLVYLDKQPVIAWDFLGTLTAGRASSILKKFIIDHPMIKHYVITTLAEDDGLSEYVGKTLGKQVAQNLSGVIGANEYLFSTGVKNADLRDWAIHNNEPIKPITPEEEYVKYYKENVCKKLGIKVLVDDDLNARQESCQEFGIKLIDPNKCL